MTNRSHSLFVISFLNMLHAEKVIFILFLSLFLSKDVIAEKQSQNIENGLPFITNYSPADYKAHGQNWSIIKDKKGFMYFGNTDGCVLQYDGVNWRKIHISNNSIVRSLAMDSGGVIYAGAQNEIGYLTPDSAGTLSYVSILSEIPKKYREFGNIWQIHFIKNRLHFNTRKYLFRRNEDGTYKIWKARNVFHASFKPKSGQFFIHQRKIGLMILNNDSLKLIAGGERFKNDWVYSILSLDSQRVLITSRNSGLFIYDGAKLRKFKTSAEKWLKSRQVYHGIILKNGQIIFGTFRGGLIVIDQNGDILDLIDKDSGLQNDQIWFVYEDEQNGIWVALNKGISHIEYPPTWSFFNDTNGLEGSVHAIVRHKGVLYAATGMGIYRLKKHKNRIGKNRFELLEGLKSQSWDLLSLNDRLLVSCNHGIFEYRNKHFRQISKNSAWQFYISKRDSNRIFIGLDQGIFSIYKKKDKWLEETRLPDFMANARTISEDNKGRLWVGTIYEGVYRIEFDETTNGVKRIKHFSKTDGLPSDRYNLVFPYKNNIVFGTTNGIYHFDEKKQKFFPLPYMSDYPKSDDVYTIISQDFKGNLLFNSNDKLICMEPQSDGKFKVIFKPFLRLSETSMYNIFPEANGLIWIGSPQGIFLYNPSNKKKLPKIFNTYIRRVSVFGDSIIFNGIITDKTKHTVLPYSSKAVRFEFSSPYYIKETQTRYRYMLKGFDSEWSAWSLETKKDYTNLTEGKYIFLAESRNIYGRISAAGDFSFVIKPPFYRCWWAYLLYFLMLIVLITYTIKRIIEHTRKKTILEHQKLEEARKKMEEELRSRLAADFHDELGTQITRISLFSEILKGDLTDISDTARNYLDKISQNAENLYNETRDFIWQLDPTKDTLNDFMGRINSFANELFDEKSIHFQLENKVNNPEEIKFCMEIRQHLIRIFKEGLHNILKYAQCKNIIFSVSRREEQLEFVLADDGKGFNVETQSDGNGLINMHNRAEKIGARYEIISRLNEGTTIRLLVKV